MSRRYSFYYAASAYLLYLVYGMVADIKNGVSENTAVSVAAAIFFAVAAGGIAWYAWRGSKAEKLAAEKPFLQRILRNPRIHPPKPERRAEKPIADAFPRRLFRYI